MKINEVAKVWGVSTDWVRKRCREYMIPSAKKDFVWEISDEAEKPPCTGNYAKRILENIIEQSNGLDVNLYTKNEEKKALIVLDYLSQWGYIENRNNNKVVQITTRGKELIRKNTSKDNHIKVKSKIDIGVLSSEVEVESYI